nr:MAG: putative RNA-dependent RNA polymerase [Totiviridae sp.]
MSEDQARRASATSGRFGFSVRRNQLYGRAVQRSDGSNSRSEFESTFIRSIQHYDRLNSTTIGTITSDTLDKLYSLNKPILNKKERNVLSSLTGGLFRFDQMDWFDALIWIGENVGEKDTTKFRLVDFTHDSKIQEVFKPRVKLDMSVRRMRMRDLVRVANDDLKYEMGYYTHLDYIFASNIMLYGLIHGVDVLRELRQKGLFNDFDTFVDKASRISTYMKRLMIDLGNVKQRLVEIGSLIGYLQNDTVNWNTVEELKGLAEGGKQHGLITDNWDLVFVEYMKKIQTPSKRVEFVTFEDYVKSDKWITSGSSSIGKVEWSYDDEKGKFKARKNMILDVYTGDELWDIVRSWTGYLESKAFIKDEVGKRRLAVASGIEPYLYESYILYLYGHGFKNWEGITLDESPVSQHNRVSGVVESLKSGAYALPFDFSRFDHQPTTKEIQTMILNLAEQNDVPIGYAQEYKKIVHKIVGAYANSEIIMKIDDRLVKEKVIGGIPSGVRSTSLIGNEWNSIMTRRAQDIVIQLLGYDPILRKGIKGDDTYLLANTAVELYLFRLAYASINAIGVNAKFGISQRNCEFLRNEISVNGVRGWSNRTLPTIIQRKPWNPQPWSPNAEVATMANNIYLLERRLDFKLPKIHLANKMRWAYFTRQSYKWLELPVRLGGFGLYRYDGWEVNCKLPLTTKPVISVENLTKQSSLSWIDLSEQQLESYHLVSFTNKISTSDIVGPQKLFGREFLLKLRKLQPVWKKEDRKVQLLKPFLNDPGLTSNARWPKIFPKYIPSNNPKYPDFQKWIREYDLLKKASQYDKSIKILSLKEYLQVAYPSILTSLIKYESNGWHRTDAITLATGDYPTEPVKELHPILTPFVKEAVKNAGVEYWKGRKNIAMKLYSVTKAQVTALMQSTTSRLYMY